MHHHCALSGPSLLRLVRYCHSSPSLATLLLCSPRSRRAQLHPCWSPLLSASASHGRGLSESVDSKFPRVSPERGLLPHTLGRPPCEMPVSGFAEGPRELGPGPAGLALQPLFCPSSLLTYSGPLGSLRTFKVQGSFLVECPHPASDSVSLRVNSGCRLSSWISQLIRSMLLEPSGGISSARPPRAVLAGSSLLPSPPLLRLPFQARGFKPLSPGSSPRGSCP